jgi:hypothetical protein
MKGDFSRLRFTPRRHYTAVLQQQGRVALDADQNEQAAIDAYLRGTELIDVVGPFGGPIGDEGFAITTSGGAIRIGAGRYYVHGLLCQNELAVDFDHQPYLLHENQTAAEILTELQQGGYTAVQVFLEVWQRFVTALDDTCLREPALGQADTTGRLQTVWRIVADGVPAASPPVRRFPSGFANLANRLLGATAVENRFTTATAATRAAIGIGATPSASAAAPAATRIASATARVAGEFFAGTVIHETGPAAGTAAQLGTSAATGSQDCCAQMYQTAQLPLGGRMSAQTSGSAADCTCEPTPPAGYRSLENQLYRVEIHRGGDETTATFKWSRENGSVVSAVTDVSGATLTVDSLGPDAYLGFAPKQWVELTDDTYEFGPVPNQPGELAQIHLVTREQLTITLAQTAPAVNPAQHARVRRWDQFGASAASDGIPLQAGTWIDLEYGIQIQFTAGNYASGDYWLIPARTASGQIDWPPCDGDGAAFQLAHTIPVYRAPLACLRWNAATHQLTTQDCRRLFSPLTDLTRVATAMHVTQFNWPNDDVWTLDQIMARGLAVTLDQGPTGKVDASTFLVSLEIPEPVKGDVRLTGAAASAAAQGLSAPTLQRLQDILDGPVTVQGNTITWHLPWLPNEFGQILTIEAINQALLPGAKLSLFARARVRLLGRMIFAASAQQAFLGEFASVPASGAPPIYLDGQTFGVASTRADGSPRTDLQLPSGAGAAGSDFESWFFVAPVVTITGLAVQPSAVTVLTDGTLIAAPATWAANTAFSVGTQILGLAEQVLQVTTAGTSGATPQPQWPSTVNATVKDGTVTWQVVARTAVTPQGTVTVNYPVAAPVTVTLSVSGGTTGLVTVPPTVAIAAKTTSKSFPVTVNGNPGTTTQTVTIVASIATAVGVTITQSATFSVTGFIVIE